MFWTWLRNWRRRRLLARPFPPGWPEYLRKNVAHYQYLTAAEQAKLRDDLRVFIAEKYWEGCGGLTMTDEFRFQSSDFRLISDLRQALIPGI